MKRRKRKYSMERGTWKRRRMASRSGIRDISEY